MKLLCIIWNCVDQNTKELIKKDIGDYAKIIGTYSLNMDKNYPDFLTNLYPKNESESDKAEYKIKTLCNKFDDNNIELIILDINPTEKVFLKQKNKEMYKNVLDMKVELRRKYQKYIKNDQNVKTNYSNAFHLTDDEIEYQEELPYILKFLSHNYHGILNIDDFIDSARSKEEYKGTRKKFWITDNLLYKENSIGTYEAYNEIFNMYFMKLFDLKNGAKYLLAAHENNYGVVTKRINNSDEKIIFLHDILKEYGYKSKKDIVNHNALQEWPYFLSDYCLRHGLNYNENCITELKKLFLYDIFTCQNDRNPTNMCLIIKNNNIRIGYFDHANMLFFHEKEQVDDYFLGGTTMDDYLDNKVSTFLVNKVSDIEFCFQDKLLHLKSFLETANEKDIELFTMYKNIYIVDNILYTFEEIEKQENIILPANYKDTIIKYYFTFKEKISIIENENRVICKRKKM